MTIGARYNITVDQGSTWELLLTIKDDGVVRNLTGWTARMQARADATSGVAVVSLSEGHGITLGGEAGTISLALTAAETAAIAARRYLYDLELVSGAFVERLLFGDFVVTPEITRT